MFPIHSGVCAPPLESERAGDCSDQKRSGSHIFWLRWSGHKNHTVSVWGFWNTCSWAASSQKPATVLKSPSHMERPCVGTSVNGPKWAKPFSHYSPWAKHEWQNLQMFLSLSYWPTTHCWHLSSLLRPQTSRSRANTSHPSYVLSKFLTHRIREHNKVSFVLCHDFGLVYHAEMGKWSSWETEIRKTSGKQWAGCLARLEVQFKKKKKISL